ncbi:MAG: hypothetical protein KDD25_07400, partial [Bdellovibrionales bacterium]|nr:hypothetical protein [Bdellovibrionales bacterium]
LDGIYNKLERNRREPLLGSIIKPKCGLSNEQFAELTYDSMLGMYEEHQVDGVDFVKDDEALSSQDAFGSDFYNRVTLTLEKVKRVEDITGRKKIYIPNITHSNIFESVRRAEFVVRSGGSAAMIDYVISGGANLDSIRRQNLDLIIHGHRTLFAAMHRPSDFGIHYRVWAKIFRMVGGDQVHSGTPELGVMSSNSADVIEVCSIVANDSQISTDRFNIDWGVTNTKSCLPICGAGLDLTAVAPLTKKLGANVAIFAGGGVHGHPEGTRAGASSMRSAANAVLEKMDLQNFVSTRKLPFLDLAYSHFLEFDKQSPNKVPRGMM